MPNQPQFKFRPQRFRRPRTTSAVPDSCLGHCTTITTQPSSCPTCGTISECEACLLGRANSTLLGHAVRLLLQVQRACVVDPRRGTPLPNVSLQDTEPVGYGVVCNLKLVEILAGLLSLGDNLGRDDICLCVERIGLDECRLWPGRILPDDETAVLLLFPARLTQDSPGLRFRAA